MNIPSYQNTHAHPLFEYWLDPHLTLYKGGVKSPLESLTNTFTWVGVDKHIAKGGNLLGTWVHKYTLKKRSRMINVQNIFFHMDYLNKLNIKYDFTQIDAKIRASIPLGLPTTQAQKYVFDTNSISAPSCSEWKAPLHLMADFFGGAHRCSDMVLDSVMVEHLKEFYPDFDGYVSPHQWPSCYHNGCFATEMCFFHPLDSLVFCQSEQGINTPTRGGMKPFPLILAPIPIPPPVDAPWIERAASGH